MKAIDDLTLEVSSNTVGDFACVVGSPSWLRYPKRRSNRAWIQGRDRGVRRDARRDGPFALSEPWDHNQSIEVERSADHYGDEPNIDGIDFRIFSDPDTAFPEFQAGNLDFVAIRRGRSRPRSSQYGESPDGYT